MCGFLFYFITVVCKVTQCFKRSMFSEKIVFREGTHCSQVFLGPEVKGLKEWSWKKVTSCKNWSLLCI